MAEPTFVSDQTPARRDRQRAPTPRIDRRFRRRTDQAGARRDRAALLAAALAVLSGCPALRALVTAAERPRPVVWVDERAIGGGDGSALRPLKQVPAELPERVELHLLAGLYAGPLALPRGAHLVGHGAAVVFLEGEGVVIEAGEAALTDVSVQGGGVGVRARGRVSLERVHFSGHRQAGLLVDGEGDVELREGRFEGLVANAVGVRVAGGALRAVGLSFRAAFPQAVDCAGGRVDLADVVAEGPATVLRAVDCRSTVKRASAVGGLREAFVIAGGTANLERLDVQGHEVALRAKSAALEVRGLVSRRAQQSGVTLVDCSGGLFDLRVEGSGSGGALQLLDSTVTVEDVRVRNVEAMGILVRKGTVTLRRVDIEGVRADGETLGDGLHLRDARVTADDVTVRDVEGSAVFAGALAAVELGHLVSERAAYGALMVERMAMVRAGDVVSSASRSSAVTATDGAQLTLGHLVVRSGGEVPVWAECAQGVLVQLGRLEAATAQPPSLCIEPLDAPGDGGHGPG